MFVIEEMGMCIGGIRKDLGEVIEDWERAGRNLHTYTVAQMRPGLEIIHYLLFEKGE